MKEIILQAAKRLGVTISPLFIGFFVACVIYKMKAKDMDLDEAILDCAGLV
jgi:hypothetical protein